MSDIAHFEIYQVQRCVVCEQDAVIDEQGMCPRCRKVNP